MLLVLLTPIFNIALDLPRPGCDFYLTSSLPCSVHYKAVFPHSGDLTDKLDQQEDPSVLPGS